MPTTWIPSAEAFGTPTQILGVGPSGIPSAEAFGTAGITHSSVTLVQPTGIPSAETFGAATQTFVLGAKGISTGEAFGHPSVNTTVTTLLCSGVATGKGELFVGDRTLSGLITGSSTLTTTIVRVISLDPVLYGFGDFFWSGPLPSYGEGFLRGFFEVVRVPRPVCPPPCVKRFQYNQTLGRGDLEIRITTTSGLPFGPVSVTFTFYQVMKGGQRMLVGPPDRRPVPDLREGQPGRYYVTGTAGELGQPGEWVCVWRYRRNWGQPEEQVEEHFRVDTSHAQGCGCGCGGGRFRRKLGWL